MQEIFRTVRIAQVLALISIVRVIRTWLYAFRKQQCAIAHREMNSIRNQVLVDGLTQLKRQTEQFAASLRVDTKHRDRVRAKRVLLGREKLGCGCESSGGRGGWRKRLELVVCHGLVKSRWFLGLSRCLQKLETCLPCSSGVPPRSVVTDGASGAQLQAAARQADYCNRVQCVWGED